MATHASPVCRAYLRNAQGMTGVRSHHHMQHALASALSMSSEAQRQICSVMAHSWSPELLSAVVISKQQKYAVEARSIRHMT